MSEQARLEGLAPYLEELVDESDRGRRALRLVGAVAELVPVDAVGLWTERSGPETWCCVATRGEERALPSADVVAAVADGELPVDLPLGRVLVGGTSPARLAIALAGCRAGDHELDLVEALLFAVALLDGASGDRSDMVLPLAPERPPTRSGPSPDGDLRGHLSAIRATQDLLARERELGAAERAHFQRVMDRECQRAGDALLAAAAGPEHRERTDGRPVSQLVVEAVQAQEAELRLAGFHIETHTGTTARHLRVATPPAELRRVLRQHIAEAIGALGGADPGGEGGGGRVEVRLTAVQQGVEVEVAASRANRPWGQPSCAWFPTLV